MTDIDGGITAPAGWEAAGASAGIKPGSTKKDCALLVSDSPAAIAGVFTRNQVKAAPVLYDETVVWRGHARAVFVNSGNANACTGEQGLKDVAEIARLVAEAVEVSPEDVAVCSTGVIGEPLPMDRIASGIVACADQLSPKGNHDAAQAIMTTDTKPKEMAIAIGLSGGVVRMGAMAKGAGMLAPNMATMLVFITCDVIADSSVLNAVLRKAADVSFNQICVDNDMSTNDTVLLLANGISGVGIENETDRKIFEGGVTYLCQELAKSLVRDGEGATKFVTIQVDGTDNDADAKTVARAIASSQLCKTAFFGQDPNWGRIACAAGYSGIPFRPNQLSIWLDHVPLVQNGVRAEYREKEAAEVMQKPEFQVRVTVGDGPGHAEFWTSDLSHDYVTINADYRS